MIKTYFIKVVLMISILQMCEILCYIHCDRVFSGPAEKKANTRNKLLAKDHIECPVPKDNNLLTTRNYHCEQFSESRKIKIVRWTGFCG
jgi:hypothetical protein